MGVEAHTAGELDEEVVIVAGDENRAQKLFYEGDLLPDGQSEVEAAHLLEGSVVDDTGRHAVG